MLGQQDIKIDIWSEHRPGRHQSEASLQGKILQKANCENWLHDSWAPETDQGYKDGSEEMEVHGDFLGESVRLLKTEPPTLPGPLSGAADHTLPPLVREAAFPLRPLYLPSPLPGVRVPGTGVHEVGKEKCRQPCMCMCVSPGRILDAGVLPRSPFQDCSSSPRYQEGWL